ncbi:cytochrome P450 [Amylocystis lapponica]|nr:cytochrome P450 [Amylocystis lapponica]
MPLSDLSVRSIESRDSPRGRIPYVDALVNEVLRWNPVAPLGIFHAASKDDSYAGYTIPRGAVVVPNVWAILHDEDVYGARPDEFIPERFLTPDGKLDPAVPDVEAAFGFGRRICPGRFMARDTMWIIAMSVLAAFDICDPVDLRGNPLTLASECATSISGHPPPFNVTLRRRPVVSESMILHGADDLEN